MKHPILSWQQFSDLLCERFADKRTHDVVEDFNKLQQLGTVDEYQEKFEELKCKKLFY